MKIALLLPNWVGDLALATPALHALRQRFPQAHITGVLKPYLADVLSGTSVVDAFLPANHQRWWGPQGFWATAGALRQMRLDTLISLRGTFRASLLAAVSGAKERVGYGKRWHARAYTQRFVPPAKTANETFSTVDMYLGTVAQLGCDTSQRQLSLGTTAEDERQTDVAWQTLRLPAPERVVLFNAGSAQSPARLWPAENFVALAQRMATEWDATVVINCGPKERDLARQIVQQANHPQVTSLADIEQLPFGLTKGLLRRVRLVVTTDSGPRHLAAAMQTPVVLLAGPIDPHANYNYHPQETAVRLDLDCMPCGKSVCPLGHHRCLRDLTVEHVYRAAEHYWQSPRAASQAIPHAA